MWEKIVQFVGSKLASTTIRTWLYVAIAFIVAGEQAWVFSKGEQHALNKIAAVTAKAATKAQLEERQAAKEELKTAVEETNKLNKLENQATTNEEKAHEISSNAPPCTVTDDERVYLKQLIDSANKTE
jgi:hypothetical protein